MKDSKELYLARAIPTRPAVLAAALSSYIETKAALTTFFLCAKHAHNSANARAGLPLEIIYQIASFHREAADAEALREWTEGFNCATNKCVATYHLSADQLEEYEAKAREDCRIPDDVPDGSLPSNYGDFLENRVFMSDDWQENHTIRMDAYQREILDETSKLSRYRNIFEGDSGIKLYFNCLPEPYPEVPRAKPFPLGGKIEAFVMLPLQEFSIKEHIGPQVAWISILGGIKPSALLSVSEAQLSLFDQTLRKLNLGSLAKLKDDYEALQIEVEASCYATSFEQDVAGTRPSLVEAEEDDTDEWPKLMLLGGTMLDVGRDG